MNYELMNNTTDTNSPSPEDFNPSGFIMFAAFGGSMGALCCIIGLCTIAGVTLRRCYNKLTGNNSTNDRDHLGRPNQPNDTDETGSNRSSVEMEKMEGPYGRVFVPAKAASRQV